MSLGLLHYYIASFFHGNVVSEEVPLVKFPNSRTQVIFFTFFHDVNRLKVKTFLCFLTFLNEFLEFFNDLYMK